MSAFRSASETSSPYITRAGYQRLREEYDELWHRRRPATVKALAAAAAEGDRSENAEYIYRKKELREIDRRVRYLQRRLPGLKVVESVAHDQSRIFFGAWVELDDGQSRRLYRIVGSDEVTTDRRHISVDSPLARALLKHRRGDAVSVSLPGGEVVFSIVDIRYVDEAELRS